MGPIFRVLALQVDFAISGSSYGYSLFPLTALFFIHDHVADFLWEGHLGALVDADLRNLLQLLANRLINIAADPIALHYCST